jgi:hypothetical protein
MCAIMSRFERLPEMMRARRQSPPVIAVLLTLWIGAASAQVVDTPMWVTNGEVLAVVRDGDTIYIGGSFSRVGPVTGGEAVLSATSDEIVFQSCKMIGNIYAVTSDGARWLVHWW